MSGIAFGLVLSVLFPSSVKLDTQAYVQRSALPESGLTMPRILHAGPIPAGAEAEGLDGTPTLEPSDSTTVAGTDLQLGGTLQDRGQVQTLPDGQQMLRINFDLGSVDDNSNDVEISKPIRFNGQEVGIANLAIDQRSQLLVSSEDLSNFLPEELFARIDTGATYIGFDDLRARGLVVSYDPLADVVEIVS
ncbi:hypothetical protein [Aurantiacibacter gilvus]|uniref:Uncharacterized protein n=1 Tax=Aurantiacibacter gilvus TaxID=3139141 RepID=A0ABU9IB57_9SPHN